MKRIGLILLALTFAGIAKAQIIGDDRDKLHFGVKGGINFANVYGETGSGFSAKNRNGFVGGGFISIPIGKYLGIQPEVLFSQKGTKAQGNINAQAYTFDRVSNTIDIPVLFQVKPIPHLAIVAGPQVSFLTSQKDTYESEGDRITIEQEFKDQSLRKANVGVTGGIDVWVLKILLSARVGADFQQNTRSNSPQNDAPTYKNFWGQLMIGLRF